MKQAITMAALLTLAASSGCTPRMAVAATAGLLVGIAVAAAADEDHSHCEDSTVCSYCRSRRVVVDHYHADPWDSW